MNSLLLICASGLVFKVNLLLFGPSLRSEVRPGTDGYASTSLSIGRPGKWPFAILQRREQSDRTPTDWTGELDSIY